jgi:uncharacterized protein (TIGR02265 family)
VADEALVFGPTFEALSRALGARLTVDAKARFTALGVDFQHLLPAYPYETWVKAMDLASQLVMPNASPNDRHAAMGRRIAEWWTATARRSSARRS